MKAKLCAPIIPLLLILTFGCEKPQMNKLQTAKLTQQISDLSDDLNAQIGVYFYDLGTAQEFQFNAKTMMHAASTMKVPVMIELFRQAEDNKLNLTDKLLVENKFYSIVDSSVFTLELNRDSGEALYDSLGKEVTIRRLITDMITHSSNLATNLLIQLVDAKNVTTTMRSLGADTIQVLRGVEDIKAFRKGWSNYTNAYDLGMIMKAIATSTAASDTSCIEMIDILSQQAFRKKIPAGIPDSVRVANKTGSITAINHDCAIVFPPERKPYILVVLTKGIAEPEKAESAIAAISKSIFDDLHRRPSAGKY
ncbi:MAG: serine hydrolase [Calditrichaeota bacterium]|nr:MAG: serine hydrolase [Calditrichota bacterium]